MRRDYTNQYGYICPTENSAVYFADRSHLGQSTAEFCARGR